MLSACGGGGSTGEATSGPCAGRADFWVVIQQDYLDELGDARLTELDPPSERVAAANESVGPALIELARDAAAVECEAEIRSGSPEICSRLDRLQPHGEIGALVVDQLQARCDS